MKIKHFREKRNISQEELAKKLDVDRSTISKWETGEVLPRASKIPLIASVLGCKIEDLFDGDDMKGGAMS